VEKKQDTAPQFLLAASGDLARWDRCRSSWRCRDDDLAARLESYTGLAAQSEVSPRRARHIKVDFFRDQ
jgi:hypothetical protein